MKLIDGFELSYYDDGKQKSQSFECEIDGDFETCFIGYGEDVEEAKEELIKTFGEYVDKMIAIRDKLNSLAKPTEK